MAQSQQGRASITSRGTLARSKALQTIIEESEGSSPEIREYFVLKKQCGVAAVERPVITEAAIKILLQKVSTCTVMRTNVNMIVLCLEEFATNTNVIDPWVASYKNISELCKICLNYFAETNLEDSVRVFRKFCLIIRSLGDMNKPKLTSAIFLKCAYKLLTMVFRKDVDHDMKALILLDLSIMCSGTPSSIRAAACEKLVPLLGYLIKMIMDCAVETQMSIYTIIRKSITSEQVESKARDWFGKWPALEEAFVKSYFVKYSDGCGEFLNMVFEVSRNLSHERTINLTSSCGRSIQSIAKSELDSSNGKIPSSSSRKDNHACLEKDMNVTPRSESLPPKKGNVNFGDIGSPENVGNNLNSDSDSKQASKKIFKTPFYPDRRKSLSLRQRERGELSDSSRKSMMENAFSTGTNSNTASVRQTKLNQVEDSEKVLVLSKPVKSKISCSKNIYPSLVKETPVPANPQVKTVDFHKKQNSLRKTVRNLEVEEDTCKVERWLRNAQRPVSHNNPPSHPKARDSALPMIVDLEDEPEIEVLESSMNQNYQSQTCDFQGMKRVEKETKVQKPFPITSSDKTKKFKADLPSPSSSVTDGSECLMNRLVKLQQKLDRGAPRRKQRERDNEEEPSCLQGLSSTERRQDGERIFLTKVNDTVLPKQEAKKYSSSRTFKRETIEKPEHQNINYWEQKLKELENSKRVDKTSVCDVYKFSDDWRNSALDHDKTFKVPKVPKTASKKNRTTCKPTSGRKREPPAKLRVLSSPLKSKDKSISATKLTTGFNYFYGGKENIKPNQSLDSFKVKRDSLSECRGTEDSFVAKQEYGNASSTYSDPYNQHNQKLKEDNSPCLLHTKLENIESEKNSLNASNLKVMGLVSPLSAELPNVLGGTKQFVVSNRMELKSDSYSPRHFEAMKETHSRDGELNKPRLGRNTYATSMLREGMKPQKPLDVTSWVTPLCSNGISTMTNRNAYSPPMNDSTEVVQMEGTLPSSTVEHRKIQNTSAETRQGENKRNPAGREFRVGIGKKNKEANCERSKDLDSGIDITSSDTQSPSKKETAKKGKYVLSSAVKDEKNEDGKKLFKTRLAMKMCLEQFLKNAQEANSEVSQKQTELSSELIEIKGLAEKLASSVSRCQNMTSTTHSKLKEQASSLEGCSKYLGPYEDQSFKALIPATKYADYRNFRRQRRVKNTQQIMEKIKNLLQNNHPVSSSEDSDDTGDL